MTEQEQSQQRILQLMKDIKMAQIDLYVLCSQHQDKFHEDLSVPVETILLPDKTKRKRGRKKKSESS